MKRAKQSLVMIGFLFAVLAIITWIMSPGDHDGGQKQTQKKKKEVTVSTNVSPPLSDVLKKEMETIDTGYSDSDYLKAKQALRNNVFKEAAKFFEKSAESGNPAAASDLGVLYFTGKGVKQDYSKAISWFEKGAEKSYVEAQYYLGKSYLFGHGVDKNYAVALEWLEMAAAQGSGKAYSDLSIMYFSGIGVEKNKKWALRYVKKSAEKNNPEAIFNLASLYLQGGLVKKDYRKAIELYGKSARLGYAQSKSVLEYQLMHASEAGDIDKTETILSNVFKDNAIKQFDFDGAVYLAVIKNKIEVLTKLGEHGANVNQVHTNEITMLMHAARRGHTKIVRYLLQKGADINAKDNRGSTALMHSKDIEITKELIKHGAELEVVDRYGKNALIMAVERHKFELVKLLILSGASVDSNRDNNTPLTYALSKGYKEIFLYLLDKGANIDAKLKRGYQGSITVLHKASRMGKIVYVEALLKKGAKVNASIEDGTGDWAGYNALLFAAYRGNINIVKLLINNGANVNSKNSSGQTPLIIASSLGHREVVQYLLEKNATINIRDRNGKTALRYTKTNSIKTLLLSKGAK